MRALSRLQALHPCIKTAMVFWISGLVVPVFANLYYWYVYPSGAGAGFFALCPACMAEMGFEYVPSLLDRAELFVLIIVVNAIIWAVAGAILWFLLTTIRRVTRSLLGPGE
jgi:hypothetical protein